MSLEMTSDDERIEDEDPVLWLFSVTDFESFCIFLLVAGGTIELGTVDACLDFSSFVLPTILFIFV